MRPSRTRAGDGARTHDIKLGKLALYQLSYARGQGGQYKRRKGGRQATESRRRGAGARAATASREPRANHARTTREPRANHARTTREPRANHARTTRERPCERSCEQPPEAPEKNKSARERGRYCHRPADGIGAAGREEPAVGIEPTTARLRIGCSTTELRWRGLLCPSADSNRDAFRHHPLKMACLPISPLGHSIEQHHNYTCTTHRTPTTHTPESTHTTCVTVTALVLRAHMNSGADGARTRDLRSDSPAL